MNQTNKSTTKLTVLVDNIPQEQIPGEWGLCILAEHKGKKILVDTGASELFAANAAKLGLDLNTIDFGTLSHAHYDHANGIPRFFRENEHAKFYLRETTDDNCYFKFWLVRKYIGIPKRLLEHFPSRIHLVSGDYQLMEGAYLIPHKTPGLEAIGKRERMYQRTKNGWKPDDFSHEQSLVLDTEHGLVIINCCSHGGAVNIIHEVQETFPGKQVYGLIGGFHLFNKTEQEVRTVAQAIRETGIQYVCTGHCTGDKSYQIMKEELGDKLYQLHVGLEMTF